MTVIELIMALRKVEDKGQKITNCGKDIRLADLYNENARPIFKEERK